MTAKKKTPVIPKKGNDLTEETRKALLRKDKKGYYNVKVDEGDFVTVPLDDDQLPYRFPPLPREK